MRKRLLTLALIVSVALNWSCGFKSDMFSNLHTEIEVSLPLGSISLTDSSLFALAGDFSSQLHVDPATKVLYVLIDDSLSLIDQARFNSIFQFGTQNFQFKIESGLPPVSGDVLVDIPAGVEQTIDLALPDGERLDQMVFGSGSIRLTMNNASGNDFSQLRVTIPQIINTKTNQPVVLSVGQTFVVTKDYAVEPIQNAQHTNGFAFSFSGKAPLVTQFEGNVAITLDAMQSAKGYFGRKEIVSPTITLSVSTEFEDFIGMLDYLYFEDPRLVFDILNQYDAPMMAKLDELKISNQTLNLKPGYNSFFVPAKGRATFVLNNQSTTNGKQLSQLIGTDFKNLVVNVNAVMNPNQADVAQLLNRPTNYVEPTVNSFSISDSLFGSYAVTIPFNAVLKNARFEQEIDLDLSSLFGDGVDISQFAFGFSGKNSMPLDIAINAFIEPEGGQRVMLFNEPIVIPASVSKNTVDVIPSVIEGRDMQVAQVSAQGIKLLPNCKKIYFQLAASTKDAISNEAVKIFSPSGIDLNVLVGTMVDLSLTAKGQAPMGKVVKLSN